MSVNSSGFDRKMLQARAFAQTGLLNLIQDAAAYTNRKLVDFILNGQSGEDYPKTYPVAISENTGGYVGVVTSNLRRSIGIDRVGVYVYRIRQVNAALAPHHEKMLQWSADRYGLNFYEIAIRLYGPKVVKELIKFIQDFKRQAKTERFARYKNPFPEG